MDPLWGCESPALPPGSMHVVVSTYNADPEQLLPWLWHLGLTNAAVYIYYRVDDPFIVRQYHGAVQLPCNMSLHVLPLLPNKGREAAVYLHHLVVHYDSLPLALMLAHDHGPASRHSLCGPFYRRARGFYRGLVEREAFLAEERDWERRARGGDAGGGEGRKDVQRKLSHFERLSSMVVTLSSGCVEVWARGCCSTFICSSSRRSCPFADADNCTASEYSKRAPNKHRHVFLHQYGMYDARYENQVVGLDGVTKPVALLRYVGVAHRSSSMWNISHEYPPGANRHSKERTLELLQELLERYEFSSRRKSWFKSCCASLLLRRNAVLRWPVQLYKELLEYSMDPLMDYEATKAVSGPGWALWLDRDYTPQDIMTYLRVDFQLKHIQGCPAQFTPQMAELLRGMRDHAEGGPEPGGGSGEAAAAGGGDGDGEAVDDGDGGSAGGGSGAGWGLWGKRVRARAMHGVIGGRGVRIPFRRHPAAAASSSHSSSVGAASP